MINKLNEKNMLIKTTTSNINTLIMSDETVHTQTHVRALLDSYFLNPLYRKEKQYFHTHTYIDIKVRTPHVRTLVSFNDAGRILTSLFIYSYNLLLVLYSNVIA